MNVEVKLILVDFLLVSKYIWLFIFNFNVVEVDLFLKGELWLI